MLSYTCIRITFTTWSRYLKTSNLGIIYSLVNGVPFKRSSLAGLLKIYKIVLNMKSS